MSPDFRLKPREHLGEPSRKRRLNEQLFRTVAPRYDRVTRLLSLGRDRAWKDALIKALPDMDAPVCLDLACGTGDLTRRLAEKYPRGNILGLDLTEPMLDIARARVPFPHVRFQLGDMAGTGLENRSVDLITGGYALRNAGDLPEALNEIYRVLKPGGRADFLDFSKPPNRAAQAFEIALLKIWGGFWGLILHRNPDVYGYIADSLRTFPDRRRLAVLFEEAGLRVRAVRRYFLGCIEWVTVIKPEPAASSRQEKEWP